MAPPKVKPEDLLKSRTFQYQFVVGDKASGPLERMATAMDSIQGTFVDTDKSTKKLFTRVSKDMRKLERSTAKVDRQVDRLKEGVDGLGKAAQGAGDAAGAAGRGFEGLSKIELPEMDELSAVFQMMRGTESGAAADTFVKNMRDIGMAMGHTAGESDALRSKVLASHSAMDHGTTSLSDYGQSLEDLVNVGVTSSDMLAKLAPNVTLTAKAIAGISSADAALSMYKLHDMLGISTDKIQGIYNTLKIVSGNTAASVEDLNGTIQNSFDNVMVSYQGVNEAFRTDVFKNLMVLQGSMKEYWAGGSELTGMITEALSGDQDKAMELSKLTGMSIEAARESFKTVEGTKAYMERVISGLQGMDVTNPAIVKSLADNLGLPATALMKIQINAGAAGDKFDDLQEKSKSAGDGQSYFNRVISDNTTGVEQLGNAISNLAGKRLPFLDTSLVEVYETMDDIPFERVMGFVGLMSKGYEFLGNASAYLWRTIPVITANIAANGGLAASLGLAATAAKAFVIAYWPVFAVVAALGGIYALYKNWDQVADAMGRAWAYIRDTAVIGTLITGIERVGQAIWAMNKVVYMLVKGGIGLLIEKAKPLTDLLSTWYDKSEGLRSVFGWMKDTLVSLGSAVLGFFSSIGTGIKDMLIMGIEDHVNSMIVDPINSILNFKVPFKGGTIGEMAGVEPLARLAAGAQVTGPTRALVGEAGTEYILPLPDFASLISGVANAASQGTVKEHTKEIIREKIVRDDELIKAVKDFMHMVRGMAPRGSKGGAQPGWAGSGDAFTFGGV